MLAVAAEEVTVSPEFASCPEAVAESVKGPAGGEQPVYVKSLLPPPVMLPTAAGVPVHPVIAETETVLAVAPPVFVTCSVAENGAATNAPFPGADQDAVRAAGFWTDTLVAAVFDVTVEAEFASCPEAEAERENGPMARGVQLYVKLTVAPPAIAWFPGCVQLVMADTATLLAAAAPVFVTRKTALKATLTFTAVGTCQVALSPAGVCTCTVALAAFEVTVVEVIASVPEAVAESANGPAVPLEQLV